SVLRSRSTKLFSCAWAIAFQLLSVLQAHGYARFFASAHARYFTFALLDCLRAVICIGLRADHTCAKRLTKHDRQDESQIFVRHISTLTDYWPNAYVRANAMPARKRR